MAEFGPVGPVHILSALQKKNMLGNYHLFLAHHTVEEADEWAKLMVAIGRGLNDTGQWKRFTIIMDNSIVELGDSADILLVKEAVKIVTRDWNNVIPVLPDVMGNGPATVDLIKEHYQDWRNKLGEHTLMAVTQGDSWESFTNTVNHLFVEDTHRYPGISWVGIPRVFTKFVGPRASAVKYVQTVAPHIQIHLLGFSDDIWDDVQAARILHVRGIDSAVPIRYDGHLTPTTTPEQIGKRAEDWFENGVLTSNQIANLARVRRWVMYNR